MELTGTRESEQPIQNHSGVWMSTRRLKKPGSVSTLELAHFLLGGAEIKGQSETPPRGQICISREGGR